MLKKITEKALDIPTITWRQYITLSKITVPEARHSSSQALECNSSDLVNGFSLLQQNFFSPEDFPHTSIDVQNILIYFFYPLVSTIFFITLQTGCLPMKSTTPIPSRSQGAPGMNFISRLLSAQCCFVLLQILQFQTQDSPSFLHML